MKTRTRQLAVRNLHLNLALLIFMMIMLVLSFIAPAHANKLPENGDAQMRLGQTGLNAPAPIK